jgi:hypothetical protein
MVYTDKQEIKDIKKSSSTLKAIESLAFLTPFGNNPR